MTKHTRRDYRHKVKLRKGKTKMSQYPATPHRPSFFLRVIFVLLAVCCLRLSFSQQQSQHHSDGGDHLQDNTPNTASSRVLNPSRDDPSNHECGDLCSTSDYNRDPAPPISGQDETEEDETEEVLTTEPPETPLLSSQNKSNNQTSTQESSETMNHVRGEIIVAVFACLSVLWLVSAFLCSVLTIFVVELQSQGRLNMDDDNFGQVSCCCIKLQLAFLLRRYAVHLDEGDGTTTSSSRSSSVRSCLMTRNERRSAMEEVLLLLQHQNPSSSNVRVEVVESKPTSTLLVHDVDDDDKRSEDHEDHNDEDEETHSIEEPRCTICLGEYDESAAETRIFTSTTCSHCFHKDCILDWLERKDNTECPCCRVPMVDNSKIYKQVKRTRKEKQKQNEQQPPPGLLVKCLQWFQQQRRPNTSITTSDEEDPFERSTLQTEESPSSSLIESSPEDDEDSILEQQQGAEDESSSSAPVLRVVANENSMSTFHVDVGDDRLAAALRLRG